MQISDFSVRKYNSSILFCGSFQKKISVGTFKHGQLGYSKHSNLFSFSLNMLLMYLLLTWNE